jgi:hypothetical protein
MSNSEIYRRIEKLMQNVASSPEQARLKASAAIGATEMAVGKFFMDRAVKMLGVEGEKA